MELILWRHAEAEIGEPDEGRALTPKGRKQAVKMAQWLDLKLPDSCRVFSSPTTRTVQTVEALERKFKLLPELAPDSTPEQILEAVNWPDGREPVLIVGHQPTLGRLAALLVSGVAQDWTIRKGNVWWIAQRERGDISTNYLRAVMTPDLIGK